MKLTDKMAMITKGLESGMIRTIQADGDSPNNSGMISLKLTLEKRKIVQDISVQG